MIVSDFWIVPDGGETGDDRVAALRMAAKINASKHARFKSPVTHWDFVDEARARAKKQGKLYAQQERQDDGDG